MKIHVYVFMASSLCASLAFCGGDNQAKPRLSISIPHEKSVRDEDRSPNWYTSPEYFAQFENKKKIQKKDFVFTKKPVKDVPDSKERQVFTRDDLRNAFVAEKYKRRNDGTLELREGHSPIIPDAKYLGFDMCHNEIEVGSCPE